MNDEANTTRHPRHVREEDVPGASKRTEYAEGMVPELKRWLTCRGVSIQGKKADLVFNTVSLTIDGPTMACIYCSCRVQSYIRNGDIIDPGQRNDQCLSNPNGDSVAASVDHGVSSSPEDSTVNGRL